MSFVRMIDHGIECLWGWLNPRRAQLPGCTALDPTLGIIGILRGDRTVGGNQEIAICGFLRRGKNRCKSPQIRHVGHELANYLLNLFGTLFRCPSLR
jgi:hypothetical protein